MSISDEAASMALKAGFQEKDLRDFGSLLERLIYMSARSEREACAKVCDEIADGVHEAEAGQCAKAIRTRNQ